jgi:hypothetical protein
MVAKVAVFRGETQNYSTLINGILSQKSVSFISPVILLEHALTKQTQPHNPATSGRSRQRRRQK